MPQITCKIDQLPSKPSSSASFAGTLIGMGREGTRKLARVLVGGVAATLLLHYGRGDSWFSSLVFMVVFWVTMGFWLFGAEYVTKRRTR